MDINNIVNSFNLAITNPLELTSENAKELKAVAVGIEILSAIVAISTLALAIFSGPLALVFAVPFMIVYWDVGMMAHNIGKIAHNRNVEFRDDSLAGVLENMGKIGNTLIHAGSTFLNGISDKFVQGTIIAKPLFHRIYG